MTFKVSLVLTYPNSTRKKHVNTSLALPYNVSSYAIDCTFPLMYELSRRKAIIIGLPYLTFSLCQPGKGLGRVVMTKQDSCVSYDAPTIET